MDPYLSLVLQGKNQWWRFALALAVIVFMWLIVSSIPVVAAGIYVAVDNDPNTYISDTGQFAGVDPLLPFIALMASFALFLAGIYLVMRYVHQRPLSTLITPASIRWGRVAQAFGIWFLLVAVLAATNLFAVLFANCSISSLASPAIFTVGELDAGYNLIGSLVAMAVFYFWFFWPERKTT